MNAFILFLHFVGLMIAAAGGLATGIIMRRAASMPPEQAKTVRGLGPLLAHVAGLGLVVLWVTGIIMVWSHWNGLGSLPGLFWVKLVFVVIVTIVTGLIHRTYAEIRRTGNAGLASRLAKLGPASGVASLLAVLFAVYAFN